MSAQYQVPLVLKPISSLAHQFYVDEDDFTEEILGFVVVSS